MSENRNRTLTERYDLTVIGIAHSPFSQRFGIPRQPGLVSAAQGWIKMIPPYDQPDMFVGLSDFSHIWVTFLFHDVIERGWRARVRPPRLGGNKTCGVFASRSPFRPNHLGQSVLNFLGIDFSRGTRLRVSGLDILDGTPVVDIKPYLPYAEALFDARGGYAEQAPERLLSVEFTPASLANAKKLQIEDALFALVRSTLALDPRPAYRATRDEARVYGLRLEKFNIRFRVRDGIAEVIEIATVEHDVYVDEQ